VASPAGLDELAAYRELLVYMTVNRLLLRYRHSWLRWAWAVLQPLALLECLSVIGSAFGGHSTAGVGYPLFILAGLSPSRRL
jgi:homopolymeric O-antigen transport system permease protein